MWDDEQQVMVKYECLVCDGEHVIMVVLGHLDEDELVV